MSDGSSIDIVSPEWVERAASQPQRIRDFTTEELAELREGLAAQKNR